MSIITVNLNDRDQSQFVYTVDNPEKDVALAEDFLLITHADGASYFNIASVQFFEINEEELGQ